MKHSAKKFIAISHDLLVAVFAFILSFYLRLNDLNLFPHNIIELTLIAVSIQSITFYFAGFYKGIWRYSSTYDLIRIIKGSSVAILLTAISLFMYSRLENFPRSVFIIDWILLILALGGGRLLYRMYRDQISFKLQSDGAKKVLIIGAGAGGEQVLREIRKNPALQMNVIGFLDDDPGKQKRAIHGVQILGKVDDIIKVMSEIEVDIIYIAIPSATGQQIKEIFEKTKGTKAKIQTLPKMKDILHGKIELSQFRNLDVEDILGRKEVRLEIDSIAKMLNEKTILITGAGGSIGSEIVRQVCQFSPQHLILIDNSEFNLYSLNQELEKKYPNISFELRMIDIRDKDKLEYLFNSKIDVVFHAAAYKHVPLVESNPYSGIDTNVRGTLIVANLAKKYNVGRFVMVSTDKAVNPTNIMGATKRIAEQVCQFVQSQTDVTKFMTVRFGNVLGSSGSVIPLFKKQIEEGGPITITHKNICRYFMSIPEASQLVIQAGSIGSGGEVFILDMGEPIKILDMAKQMISLAGLEVDKDINIEFIGLRPGEKMFEELLLDGESALPTLHPLVKIAKVSIHKDAFKERLDFLLNLPISSDVNTFKQVIKTIVPEFKSDNLVENSIH
ncbi:MAG: hypothetical protein COV38_03200 [Bdellovibrionales bacterium CG11_big_fil_rev_8_21_14_0_20_38_13]|nr:MAG: hypothetical protein COW79_15705 [Bdellovibrionales bacterium CG22_combo_CG10-13_8_21_14_all_38_13]PIR30911.1 MAG: hypothetical protein COV38_03200 [Bdellovibrionales bacterium CG11_big_fil_rev_8_21_14_0_20_38_13]